MASCAVTSNSVGPNQAVTTGSAVGVGVDTEAFVNSTCGRLDLVTICMRGDMPSLGVDMFALLRNPS